MIEQINATGYGLTLGVHSRIDETIAQVVATARAGNVYVNRNMVGAVVGVQPFGGEGLSGTGPKAGGPLYLYRLLAERPDDAMARALDAAGDGSEDDVAIAAESVAPDAASALSQLRRWASDAGERTVLECCDRFVAQSRAGASRLLRGPTGERNIYTLVARDAVLCLADDDADRLVQLAAVLAVGSRAVWPDDARALHARLSAPVREHVELVADWSAASVRFDAAIHHGGRDALLAVCARLAERPGPIVGVDALAPGDTRVALERLVVERALSVNTAAAGGNATLMTLQ
jgi:RHH-type proline utilization regulon transcriptional repressor/proline dehydrogenase/delta 1-pyrroline-5-carboxylate dehydrogenase